MNKPLVPSATTARTYPLLASATNVVGEAIHIGLSFERTPLGYRLAAAHLRGVLSLAAHARESAIVGAAAGLDAMAAHEESLAETKKGDVPARAEAAGYDVSKPHPCSACGATIEPGSYSHGRFGVPGIFCSPSCLDKGASR